MTTARVLARVVAALLLVALAGPLVWRVATGDFYLTVEGRSMTPTYQVGDVLVVQQPDGAELTRTGEIVVVAFSAGDAPAEDAPVYVHRVVEPLDDGTAWLQGDGNEERDPRPVSQDAVRGTPRFALTGPMADAFQFTQSVVGRVVLGGAALLLLLLPLRRRADGAVVAGADDHAEAGDPGGEDGPRATH